MNKMQLNQNLQSALTKQQIKIQSISSLKIFLKWAWPPLIGLVYISHTPYHRTQITKATMTKRASAMFF